MRLYDICIQGDLHYESIIDFLSMLISFLLSIVYLCDARLDKPFC